MLCPRVGCGETIMSWNLAQHLNKHMLDPANFWGCELDGCKGKARKHFVRTELIEHLRNDHARQELAFDVDILAELAKPTSRSTCMLCNSTFASVEGAVLHLQNRVCTNACPTGCGFIASDPYASRTHRLGYGGEEEKWPKRRIPPKGDQAKETKKAKQARAKKKTSAPETRPAKRRKT
jgi:hypothetical protein